MTFDCPPHGRLPPRGQQGRGHRRGPCDDEDALPRVQRVEEQDRAVGVGAHRPGEIQGRCDQYDGGGCDNAPAQPPARHDEQTAARHEARQQQRGVHAKKEQQARQEPRQWCEKRDTVHVCTRHREQRGEGEGLHHHLGIRVPCEPDLGQVQREQHNPGECHRSAEKPDAGEIYGKQPKHREYAGGAPRPRESIDSVSDGDRRWI